MPAIGSALRASSLTPLIGVPHFQPEKVPCIAAGQLWAQNVSWAFGGNLSRGCQLIAACSMSRTAVEHRRGDCTGELWSMTCGAALKGFDGYRDGPRQNGHLNEAGAILVVTEDTGTIINSLQLVNADL